MKIVALLLIAAAGGSAAVNITTVAAATTIAVNTLEIKQNIQKIRVAAKATKRAVVKAAKKVRGKK
jgi:hypothetical protein